MEELRQQIFDCVAASNLITWFWPDCSQPRMCFSGVMLRPLGYEAGDLEPDYPTFVGLAHPEDRAILEELFARHLAAEKIGEYEARVRLKRKDGRYARVRAMWSLVRANPSAPLSAFGVIRIIDLEQARQYSALQLTHDALHAVLNRIGHAVVLLSSEGMVVQANEATSALVGLAPAHLVGTKLCPFLEEADGTSLAPDFLQEVVTTGRQGERELQRLGRWWHVHLVPLTLLGVAGARVLLLAEDITAKKAEQTAQLARQKALTEALVREVHHRIKNHLQGLVGLLRTYTDTDMSASSVIDGAVTRILSIATVHGLLARNGQHTIEIAELITQIVATLRVNSSVPLGFTVVGASCRATEVQQNEAVPLAIAVAELYTNAIKHTPRSAQAHVRSWLTRAGNEIELRVANGPAALPRDFNLSRPQPGSAGLELVQTLLPPRRSKLEITQEGEDVVARLRLDVSDTSEAAGFS